MLDTSNPITFNIGSSNTTAFSPISKCNLVAVSTSSNSPQNIVIYKRPNTSDLSLTKTAKKCSEDKGIFTITVTNNAPSDAPNVIVSDLVPTGLKVDKVIASGWTVNINGQQITATLPTLAAGVSSTIEIKVDIHCKNALVINSASVVSSNCDFNPQNNSAFTALQCKNCQ